MKKLTALLLILAMVCAAFAGCAQPAQETATEPNAADTTVTEAAAEPAAANQEPTKLTLILRGGTYGDVIKAALPEFEAANNCTCEVLELAFDELHTKIALDAVNAQGAYDLCMVDGSWMAEFTANNVLTDLSAMGYSFDEDIIPATTSICKVGDSIYLAPFFGNVTVLLYNKQLIADAGYQPEDIDTFAEVMDIAQKTNAAGKLGFIVRGGSGDNIVSDFIPHLLAYGGWVVDENNKPTVNTDAFKAAFTNYIDLYKLGDTMDKDDIVAAIDSGSAAMAIGWPGWYVPSADSAASYIVIPTKLDDNDTAKNTSMYGVWTIGICNNSQNKELTLKLLEYLMDQNTQLASVANGGVPCRYSSLLNADVLATHPQLETVCSALQTGVYRPVIEQWSEFTNILGTEMDSVIQGTKTMDQGLADAQAALEALMS
ncbi:MAG TPA: extracellular solute-binding protein [Clostridia bacterium]|jgi:ABC-type glycerol-3-phosphate transport system substrate-binding protein|nr:extracellular solute-binding protein [Clostridia bacterium]